MGNLTDSSGSYEQQVKKTFGQLVLRLRRERGWSQKYLDHLSNVPWRTILDIEHADKAALDRRTVTALSTAFQLTGKARREFFLTAGLKPDITPYPTHWQHVIHRFYHEHKLPAFVTDRALYIHSFNSFYAALLQISPFSLLEKHLHYGHINVLHFMFDPAFKTCELYREKWEILAAITVQIFRLTADTRSEDDRNSRTLSQLKEMQDFGRLWDTTDLRSPHHFTEPVVVHHSKYGKLSYWHMQPILPEDFFEDYRAVFTPPADQATEEAFIRMQLEAPFTVYTLPVDT